MLTTYHPDPEIDAEVAADALDAERADLAAGYPPLRLRRHWRRDGRAAERRVVITDGHGRCEETTHRLVRCLHPAKFLIAYVPPKRACGVHARAAAAWGTKIESLDGDGGTRRAEEAS